MVATSNASGIWSGARTSVAVGASPFTFTNTENCPIICFIAGGTLSALTFSRVGIVFDNCGILAGMVALNPNDQLVVTYAMAPMIAYYPQ